MEEEGQQAFCSRRQVSDVVLFISFLLDPQPGREVLQEKEHKEQLASSGQSSFFSSDVCQRHPRHILGEAVLLEQVILQPGVGLLAEIQEC